MNISALSKYVVAAFVAGIVACGMLAPVIVRAQTESQNSVLAKIDTLNKCGIDKAAYGVAKTVKMMVTAYSSTPDQTDDTPFITASGKHVEDCIIAINGLKFGTKVRLPELYGEKVFIVEDRMHPRKGKYHADIWFSEYREAKEFGAKVTHVEILES